MTRRTSNSSEFGASVSSALAEAKLTQNALATRIGASPSHFNQVLTGRKNPSAEWANLVAHALGLQEERRIDLHYAVARDLGLDLTKG